MFFDRLTEACAAKHTSPSAIALKVNRSKSNVTGWSRGQVPASDTLTSIAKELDMPAAFLLEQPPFDCWDLINSNRKGFLHYTGITPEVLDLVWAIDAENPDSTPLTTFVTFIADAITSARPTTEGDWVLEVKPMYLTQEKTPTLSKKDERDIAKALEDIMTSLEGGGDLMFDGDPLSDEAKTSIMAAVQLGLENAKMKNKERFTPKRYRKE